MRSKAEEFQNDKDSDRNVANLLDIDEDGSDDYGSESEDEVKGGLHKDISDNESDMEEEEQHAAEVEDVSNNTIDQDQSDGELSLAAENSDVESAGAKVTKSKELTKAALAKKLRAVKNSGVVYVSRLPPFMRPQKLKQILEQFGEVTRIYCTPEDQAVHAKRVKFGGNKRKNYVEGWAEFKKKSKAKLAAETLNGRIIGGKKRSHFHDDILSIKYLSKFKWHHLMEQMALEEASRHEKMRAEINQANRERTLFSKNIQIKQGMESFAKKAATENSGDKGREDPDKNPVVPGAKADNFKPMRSFDQKKANVKSKVDSNLDSVLGNIF